YAMDFTESDIYNLHNVYQEYDADSLENISDLDYWNYRQSIVSDFSAVNFKIGGLYRFGRALRLGAAVKTPTTYRIKETWADSWDEYYDSGESFSVEEQSGSTQYKIRTPYSFSFGGSFKFLNFLVSAAADFEDWSQAEFLTNPPVAGQTKNQVNARIQKDFKSITRYRLGAEMYIPIVRARIRAGYFEDPSPYRYTDIRPDKKFLTAGAGLMLGRQAMVELSLQHGMWQRKTIDDLTNSPAKEDITFDKVVGTLSIRF
ncbi:MAG: outer membrane protein transport protein, partial [candidate division KSB1 bacterium]|nr:outer membrane protein transport protein [candidate division KSB1 bacterium]